MFVRLKLRMTANNFRGQPWRVALFVTGVFFGLWWAAGGFLLFAVPGLAGSEKAALLVAGFGGGALTLGWVLFPLVFFGVDETLDPARFALLPLRRRTLVAGMVAAALLGIPALATLASTAGLVLSAGALGGWTAAVAQAVGVAAGLLLCVAASRAVTSAFATMLRSRRMRDLAAIALAVLAALLGPLQIGLITAAETADWDRLVGPARVVGWTPLAAGYTLGFDVAAGRAWAVPLKLAVVLATTAALLWWWSWSLESAMVGSAGARSARAGPRAPKAPPSLAPRTDFVGASLGPGAAGPEAGTPTTAGPTKAARGGAVDQLVPRGMRWMTRNRYAALVARETRYWWRDVRRRAGLITVLVVGVFLPVMINIAGDARSPGTVSLSMIFVGTLAAVTLANQFGYDGTAYGANVVAGVPGRLELRARVAAFTVYAGPLMAIVAVAMSLLLGEPTWAGLLLGALAAAYGAGLAANLFVSILAAYALPETSNPFTINTGAGVAKSLLSLASMLASAAAAVPMVVAAALLGDAPVWLWLAGPVGVGYGVGAAALGVYLAGDLLDRRMPELLAAITPRR